MKNDVHVEQVESAFASVLDALPNLDGKTDLRSTPARYAKYLAEQFRPRPFKFSVFVDQDSDSLVVQEGIFVRSLCEHHVLPFFGTAFVGYVPNSGRVVGLSKLARVVEHFATGLQIQERIARLSADFLFNHEELAPLGVGISLRCIHTCMTVRGACQQGAVTTTNTLRGVFKTDPALRAEFLRLVKHPPICQ